MKFLNKKVYVNSVRLSEKLSHKHTHIQDQDQDEFQYITIN